MDKKVAIIFKEVLAGLGLGFLGIMLFISFFGKLDLLASILFGLITFYLFSSTGIFVVGYYYLKYDGRQKEFLKYTFRSFLGFILGLGLYFFLTILTFEQFSHYLSSNVLPIVLPFTGMILGFNYNLVPDKHDQIRRFQ